jgi:hypothetical protein
MLSAFSNSGDLCLAVPDQGDVRSAFEKTSAEQGRLRAGAEKVDPMAL